MMRKSTEAEQAQILVRHWKHVLGLASWRIQVIMEPTLEPQGRVYWEGRMRDATILLRPVEKTSKRDPLEKIIIHELVHLQFAPLGDPPPDWVEDAVERMAWALYNTRHSKGK